MKNLPIIGKFLTVLALFGVFVLGVAFYATNELKKIDAAYSSIIDTDAATPLLARGNRATEAARASIGDLMIATSDETNRKAEAEIAASRTSIVDFMDQAAKAAPSEAADIEALKAQSLAVIDNDCAASIRLGKAATSPADVLKTLPTYEQQCAPKFAPQAAAIAAKVDAMTKAASKASDELTATTRRAIMTTYGVILGGLVLVVGGAFFAIRAWVARPLQGLNDTMQSLARGDLGVAVTGEDRRDEVGAMAKTVQVFKDAAIEKQRLEAEAADQRRRTEEERARNEAEREAAAKQQAMVVESLATGLSKLSDGDLMFRLNTAFAAEYEKLRSDFNDAMEKLEETMRVVSANTGGIRAGAQEISQASDDLSRRTEQQAASLEETAAALDEITATVRKTASGAKDASEVVTAAKAEAEHSGVIVAQAVQAMGEIEQSSGQISQIIGVIDEIAFQTNLLALNAGVEAARAGDAGKGFAVVASEVRALAQRSAEAAKEIKTLISSSSQQVGQGVALVGDTGRALQSIVTQVARIDTLVLDIAASAQEQATGLQQVNTAVNQMDQVVQQNAAMVEEQTAATHALKSETSELSALIARFKVAAGKAVSRSAPRPAGAGDRAAPSPARAMARRVAAGVGAAAVDDDWAEF
ncbi:HAMP domain-containing methyl-accepting chemotaxis protein [Phenylobacterium sp.]|jgi:methyl-accepting chemotaxis protein|uniref:methyl-accepting chemotaxis protein n=1 Tax=Phenylobacterium sp. TaxID=1871053 RepID=UPI002E369274|nr:HAMP domain-containing methyl-accepting chemotaxis protein [Phenylobacterium sp.]HEX3367574.1 HAMP domain-containing methyl-accepting chemotaxis protein [Phenylobacterium sp.]